MLAALLGKPFPAGSYEPAIRRAFGDRASEVLKAYPRATCPDDATAWAAVYTDSTFACAQLRANDLLTRRGTVHAYEFADTTAPPPLPPLPGAPASGAAHSSELPYLFDMASQPIDLQGKKIPLTRQQHRVADTMVSVWTRFARDGRVPVKEWGDGGRALTFTPTGTAVTDPARRHRCGLWKGILQG